MNPLKQGLKQKIVVYFIEHGGLSLSMNPLKQGLKPPGGRKCKARILVFIHESIKTRVETPGHFQ